MRSNLTILTPEEKELPLPYDVPIFIGPSLKRHRQSISFVDAQETVIPVALDQMILFKDPVATIYFYDQITTIGNIKYTKENRVQITNTIDFIEPMSSRQCICAFLKADNSISTVIGIDKFIHHTVGVSLSAIQLCEQPTPGEATKIVILGLKKLVINGGYDIVSHTVKIKYEKNPINLPVDKLRSFIEYDIVNNDRSYIADPKALIYPEQNSDILLGINKCEKKSIVIPAYTQSEKYVQSNIKEILDAIDLRNQGAYIAPIDASTELRSALLNYVNLNDKRILLLPGQAIYSNETKSSSDETLNHSGGGTVTFKEYIFALVAIIRYNGGGGAQPPEIAKVESDEFEILFDAQRDTGVPYITNFDQLPPGLNFLEKDTFYLFYCSYDTPFNVENPYIVRDPDGGFPSSSSALDGRAIRIAVDFDLDETPSGYPPYFLDAISLKHFNPPENPDTPWSEMWDTYIPNDGYPNQGAMIWIKACSFSLERFKKASYIGAFTAGREPGEVPY